MSTYRKLRFSGSAVEDLTRLNLSISDVILALRLGSRSRLGPLLVVRLSDIAVVVRDDLIVTVSRPVNPALDIDHSATAQKE